jgi:anaerobic selenocysteine-containing dehydrogenase
LGEYCENGVKAVTFETTAKRVGPDFFARHPVGWLRGQTHHWLENQGRLTHPMRYDRATDRYVPISWEDAFALIGKQLKALDSPDRAIFYTSGRTSNEAAFLYQLFARRFGTNNLPDCSNMCHESSRWRTSSTPTPSSSSARTPAPTTRGCWPTWNGPPSAARGSSPSTRSANRAS